MPAPPPPTTTTSVSSARLSSIRKSFGSGPSAPGPAAGLRRQCVQDAARRDRNLADLNTIRLQCVVDGVCDCRARTDGAALAHALDAEFGVGRRRFHVENADIGNVWASRQQIVRK